MSLDQLEKFSDKMVKQFSILGVPELYIKGTLSLDQIEQLSDVTIKRFNVSNIEKLYRDGKLSLDQVINLPDYIINSDSESIMKEVLSVEKKPDRSLSSNSFFKPVSKQLDTPEKLPTAKNK